MNSGSGQRGFTLPELVVAVVVFGLVAVIGLSLIRPADFSAARHDAERWVGVAHLAQALQRYIKTTGSLPPGVAGVSSDGVLVGADDGGMLDLCSLVPQYAKALPVDPLADLGDGAACGNSTEELPLITGYAVRKVSDTSYEILAPLAERDEEIILKVTF